MRQASSAEMPNYFTSSFAAMTHKMKQLFPDIPAAPIIHLTVMLSIALRVTRRNVGRHHFDNGPEQRMHVLREIY